MTTSSITSSWRTSCIVARNSARRSRNSIGCSSASPGHFWAQYLNAICLLRQGRPAEARTLLSACLAQRSDFVWLYLLRGFAQEELQAWDAADADFQKASQIASR